MRSSYFVWWAMACFSFLHQRMQKPLQLCWCWWCSCSWETKLTCPFQNGGLYKSEWILQFVLSCCRTRCIIRFFILLLTGGFLSIPSQSKCVTPLPLFQCLCIHVTVKLNLYPLWDSSLLVTPVHKYAVIFILCYWLICFSFLVICSFLFSVKAIPFVLSAIGIISVDLEMQVCFYQYILTYREFTQIFMGRGWLQKQASHSHPSHFAFWTDGVLWSRPQFQRCLPLCGLCC